MPYLGWLFLVIGSLALIGVRRGWFESAWFDRLDSFGVHRLLDRPSIAGGRLRYYRTLGWTFVGLGVLLLIRALLGG